MRSYFEVLFSKAGLPLPLWMPLCVFLLRSISVLSLLISLVNLWPSSHIKFQQFACDWDLVKLLTNSTLLLWPPVFHSLTIAIFPQIVAERRALAPVDSFWNLSVSYSYPNDDGTWVVFFGRVASSDDGRSVLDCRLPIICFLSLILLPTGSSAPLKGEVAPKFACELWSHLANQTFRNFIGQQIPPGL